MHTLVALLASAWVGTGLHAWSDPALLELAAKAGIGTVRTEIRWKDGEPEKGKYVIPKGVEDGLGTMKRLGIRPSVVLTHVNDVAYPDDPLNAEAFGNWAAFLAKRFKGRVDAFEVFNEGWTFGFRKRYGDKWVDEFVRFTRIVADKIHVADPKVTVMVAAEDGWSALHDMLCKSIGKAGECVSFHPYVHADDPRPERKDLFFRDRGQAIRDISYSHGGARRFRISEIGWSTYVHKNPAGPTKDEYPCCTEDEQARYLIRAYLFARIHGVECVMQYDFRDDDFSKTDPECNFGLVRRDNTPKKSYRAVCAMTRLVGELEPAGDLSSDPAKYHVMRFRGKGGHDIFAAWSVEGEAKVPRPAEIPPSAVRCDLLGARLGESVPEALTLTEDPVYFVRH